MARSSSPICVGCSSRAERHRHDHRHRSSRHRGRRHRRRPRRAWAGGSRPLHRPRPALPSGEGALPAPCARPPRHRGGRPARADPPRVHPPPRRARGRPLLGRGWRWPALLPRARRRSRGRLPLLRPRRHMRRRRPGPLRLPSGPGRPGQPLRLAGGAAQAPAGWLDQPGATCLALISTRIEDDLERCVRSGGEGAAGPFTMAVNGQDLSIALIRSPSGNPIELIQPHSRRPA